MFPTAPSARSALQVLLLATLLLAACGQSPEVKKQQALERAQRFFQEQKLSEAIIELQNALQVDDQFVPALHTLGRVYAERYWYFDAIRELRRAAELAPDSLEIAADLGRTLAEVGEWDGAEAAAARILSREPDHPSALYIRAAALLGRGKPAEALPILTRLPGERIPAARAARAEALFQLGKPAEAEEILRAELSRDPKDTRSLFWLGTIHLSRKNYEEAERLFAEARTLRPEDPRLRLGLAAAKARQGKVAEAIQELRRVSPRARNAVIVRALGRYYLEAGRPADAILLLSPLVNQLQRPTAARFLLGVAYLAAGSPERALVEFRVLERESPTDRDVQFQLARAEARLGQPREALARLDRLAGSFAKLPEYHLERGRTLLLLGRLDAAHDAATAAARLAPEGPQAYLVLAEIRRRQGNDRAARELLLKAASADAGFVPARLALGRFLLSAGEPDAALKEFEAAVAAEPHSLPAAREKAFALADQGRIRAAIEFVQDAVRADPGNPGFNALLGSLYLRDRQWDKAAAAFRTEIGLDPKAADARLGLTTLALREGKEAEAVGHLQEVVKVAPERASAVLLLVSLYAKQGRADLAVPVVEAAVKASPREPTFLVSLGDLYLKTGRYDQAIARMTEALARNPDLSLARLIRGRAHLANGDGATAVRELADLARANPRSPEAQYFLAHAYLGLGRTRDAEAAYREAIRLAPTFEAARLELASLSRKPEDETAQRRRIDELRAAIKLEPKNVLLRETLARALFLRGQREEAQAELRHILEIAPLHLSANFLTARILLQQGRGEEAARHLQAVLRSNPAHAESHVLLARQFQDRGRLPEAITHLESALAADPRLPEVVRYQLGTLYARSGRLGDALAMADELEQASQSPAAPLLRGFVLLQRRSFREAVDAFGLAVRRAPDLPEAHRGLGQAYGALEQPDRAIESLRRALALDGTDPLTLNNLAWLLSEAKKKPEEALRLATKAAEIAPQAPDVMDTLGWIHYRRGAYQEAEKTLRRAVELAPDRGAIHYHLGMTYYRLGRTTDALYTLRRAAQLDPKLAEAEGIGRLIKELEG